MPDPITHTSISFIIARHWFRDQKGFFVLTALSPDLDVVIGGIFILLTAPFPTSIVDFTQASLIFHPGLTAALWFVPFYSLLWSWGLRAINKTALAVNFSRIYTIATAGVLLHLALDLLQTGNRPFWPLELQAGLDLLPVSPLGRLLTIAGALALLILDAVLFPTTGLSPLPASENVPTSSE